MHRLIFWDHWETPLRRVFTSLIVILVVLIIALLVSVWKSPAPSINWSYFQQREILEKPIHNFQTGPFALQVTGDNIVLKEQLVGSEFIFKIWPAYFLLSISILGLIILTTVVSTFTRFWFFICSGILIFLLSNLQLELLNVMGQSGQTASIFLIIMVVGAGVIFQYYFPSARLLLRLFVFSGVVIFSFVIILLLANAPNPPYLLGISFIPSVIAASIILAIVSAHEIIALIIYLITRGLKGTNVFLHFSLLTLIYLANLVATYLNDQAYLKWDYSLSPILLLTVSGILAIWGIRQQEEQRPNFLLSGATGPLAVMGLLIIAAGSSLFFYLTANDAAIETIRNMSLYAHIGFGSIFFLYIIANFGALLKENYKVSKVLYKPSVMPYFTFRFAGIITVAGFVLYNFYLKPLRDTTGARDAAMGDYYVISNNLTMAEGFYKKSTSYAFHNHHANYILGNIEGARGNDLKERQYYLDGAERRPTQQAYMNVIKTLNNNPINIYAYLSNFKKDFPYSGVANNSYGLVYADLKQVDSAIYFFNEAKKDNLTANTADINLLSTSIKYNIPFDIDSLYNRVNKQNEGSLSNLLALANHQNVRLNIPIALPQDSAVDLFSASLINNYIINHIDSLDTALIASVEKTGRQSKNRSFSEDLLNVAALAYYQNGLVNRAFKLMQEVTINSDKQGKKNNTMALWALEQNAPQVAINYAQFSYNQNYKDALLTNAIALIEFGRIGEGVVLFDSLKNNMDEFTSLAESLQRILVADSRLIKNFNDLEKYAYSRYRLSYDDWEEFNKVIETIENPNWKARAILDRSKKLFSWEEVNPAIETFNMLTGITITDNNLFYNIQLHELLMAAETGNIEILKSKVPGFEWRGSWAERNYLEAMVSMAKGDSVTAKSKLMWLKHNNSFFDDGILAVARFEKSTSKNPLESYSTLADALHVNPGSIKILKAYITEAHANGFDEYASQASITLQQILPEPLFARFIQSLQ